MARIRTPDESPEAGWHSHFRKEQVFANLDDWKQCSTEDTGCFHVIKKCEGFIQGTNDGPRNPTMRDQYLFYDFDEGQTPTVGQRLPISQPLRERPGLVGIARLDMEHVAGPGCQNTSGYNGNNISPEEMRGCQNVQVLLPKEKDWQPSSDGLEVEATSNFYLTGIANCHGLILREWNRYFGASTPTTDACAIFSLFQNRTKQLM